MMLHCILGKLPKSKQTVGLKGDKETVWLSTCTAPPTQCSRKSHAVHNLCLNLNLNHKP